MLRFVASGIRLAVSLAVLGAAPARAEPTVEVMHWWTSGGEAQALKVLKDEFEKGGGRWVDVPVAGGGGDAARTVLKTRIVGGNPPTAAQMHMGPEVWDWGKEGVLSDLDKVAKAEKWDELLPPFVAKMVKSDGKYVAAPVNIHRANWLWVNPAALQKAGVASAPTTWDEFNAAAEKLQKAGITPLAHGGQPWQDLLVFDAVALGVGGVEYYRKAFLELDQAALAGPTTIKVFEQMRRLKGFVDRNSPGRDWNQATAMVTSGQGAMQIMGDWAKAELMAGGKQPGKDFLCVPTPGSNGAFTAINDSFAMFAVKGDDRVQGQERLASLVVGERFQEAFNLAKGSIPARRGVSPAKFDACGKQAMSDFEAAIKADKALPTFGTGLGAAVVGAITDVVTAHFNGTTSAEDATKQLAAAVKVAH
jgi:glucose/mannose transport system substrate-binding protein